MNVMFTYALARRLSGTGITTNALHPGAVATGFGRNNRGLVSFAISLLSPLMKSPEKGARTSIYLASSPEVAHTTGQYFSDSRLARSNAASHDEAAQERLWHISEQLVSADQTPTQRGAD
jgi:NAD(P)-dependent dehydrogenase (short-subunit alcohol dehydrogenase family)